MANKLKVGDIVASSNNSDNIIYCIFRIGSGSVGVATTINGFVYHGPYENILYKVRSTKKRKNAFIRTFDTLLLSPKKSHEFTNLDYVDVIEALLSGPKKSR